MLLGLQGMIIARIAGVTVTQNEDGSVVWTSGAEIDADGANGQAGGPFAYRYPDDDGLDRLIDAGWPNEEWTDVLYSDGSGHPLTDGNGNVYSKTSLILPGSVANRAVDAWSVPYVVVNPHVQRNAAGVILGCLATVSYQGRSIEAVVADVGPSGRIGEISVAAAKALGIADSPLSGGVSKFLVSYMLYPNKGAAVLNGITYPLQRA
jgi:hypothetical protein